MSSDFHFLDKANNTAAVAVAGVLSSNNMFTSSWLSSQQDRQLEFYLIKNGALVLYWREQNGSAASEGESQDRN